MDGRQLLAEFIEKNTTPAQFAREAECSQSHLSLFLKGERGVSVPMAKRMSKAASEQVSWTALVEAERVGADR